MRPKLKGDTFYIPTPDGVYLNNNHGPLKMKGKVIYRWIERLAPYLNGAYTLEEITQGLSEEKRAMVTQLITLLHDKGFIKDVATDHPHTLSAVEEQLYAPEIAFIDSFVDSAAFRFERYRECRLLLIGSGLSLTALVSANLKSGVRQIAVLTTDECATDQRRHEEYLHLYNQQGSRQELLEVKSPCWQEEAEVAAAIQAFDVIIFASDRPMLARARMLTKLCRVQQKIFIPAVIVDNYAWIGPLLHPETRGCWECSWLRLQAHLAEPRAQFSAYSLQDQPAVLPSRFIAMPTAAIIANELSFEIFKYLSGVGALETEARLLSVDLETLQIQRHAFQPHPLCTTCQTHEAPTAEQFRATISQVEQGSPIEQEVLSKQIATCFESHCGLFISLAEQDFIQLPLNISQVTISNPMAQEKLRLPIITTGAGTDISTSRWQATQRACEIYAASLVDVQRFPLLDSVHRKRFEVQADWWLAGDCDENKQAHQDLSRQGEDEQLTWAWNLQTRRVCLVPACLAYPELRGSIPAEETTPGFASGLSYAEAISRALFAHCKQLTIADIARAREPFSQVDLASLSLDAEGARYRHLLELLAEVVTVYDITGPLQIPTFAFCRDHLTLTYSSHLDVKVAMRVGLERVLQQYQSVTNQQPQYALPMVPELPADARGNTLVVPHTQTPLSWPETQAYLQNILQAQGWQMFVVPLHADPVLTEIFPYIVHVLLARI